MADKRFSQENSKSNNSVTSEKDSLEKSSSGNSPRIKLDEFGVIEQFFKAPQSNQEPDSSVKLGIGDDAAELNLNTSRLVVATDTLNNGVHFPERAAPAEIASRAVAVNLSDFAAMGAVPRWATLSLSAPLSLLENEVGSNQTWIQEFSRALLKALAHYEVSLVGGDTTKGPLAISLTILGEPYGEHLLKREQAKAGDDLWVSGYPGLGAASLDHVLNRNERFLVSPSKEQKHLLNNKFYQPVPRIELGKALTTCANAAIDISDGLVGDAGHIAHQSRCRMSIQSKLLPIHPLLTSLYDESRLSDYVLGGGDDYELLFTARPDQRSAIEAISQNQLIPLTMIGSVKALNGDKPGVELIDGQGELVRPDNIGYRHF